MVDIASKPLTRRDLLGLVGGLVGGLAADSALAGVDKLSGAPIGQPRIGGRIRVAGMSLSTADTLDPARAGNSSDYMRVFLLYSGLRQYEGAFRTQPGLAESIESADNITWTIRLRRGVQFHNGKPLTADDVVYSLMRHRDPAVGSKVKAVAEQFDSARRLGPLELELRLTGPNPDIPTILAQPQFLIVEDGRRDFSVANGTGPYILKSFAPGIRAIVRRNPHYWKPGKPYLEEVELIAIPDEISRVNALLSGDIHLTIALSAASVKRVRATSTHDVMETKSGVYTNLILRQDHPVTGNPDFVLAMKHLLDRDLIKRALFRDFATLANDQPISPLDPYYNHDIPQRVFDPEKARFLLKRSGLLGTRLPVYVAPAATLSVDMGSILQQRAAEIGLKLAVNRVPSDGYWSTHWMKHPITFGNINQRPTADLIFSLFFQSGAAENEAGWKNPRFDQMLIDARRATDEAKRKQIYGDMQWMVHEQGGIGIPVFISLLDGHDRRIRGLQPIPLGGLMGYTFGEHVWWDA